MDYGVVFGGTEIGRASVVREKLYYRIACSCALTDNRIHRLEVSCGDRSADLGILVPENGVFVLSTRIPVNRIGEGEMRFAVIEKESAVKAGRFVPIKPEEPFRYLSRLKNAFLEIREGQKGAFFPDCQRSSSSPTGQ